MSPGRKRLRHDSTVSTLGSSKSEGLVLPPLPTPEEDWAERAKAEHTKDENAKVELSPEMRMQLHRLQEAAIVDASGNHPRSQLLEAQKKSRVPEQYAPAAWFYYWRIYVRELASRYIRESGATLESVVAVTSWGEWDMAGTLVAPPSGPPLVKADGSPAQTWDAWLKATYPDGGEHFVSLLTGLRSVSDALRPAVEAKRQHEAAEKARLEERARLISPPLRIGTRAVKNHTRRKREWLSILRTLRTQNRLTDDQHALYKKQQPVALTTRELLVVAGCLHLARMHGGLRQFGPARAKLGGYTFDKRLAVEMPNMKKKRLPQDFLRLLGYQPGATGVIDGGDARQVEEAFEQLTTRTRPIVVKTYSRNGAKWRESFEIVEDVPIRRVIQEDGSTRLELHATLADGYWWGHLTFDRLPQRWERARIAMGLTRLDEGTRWADIYFRQLAIGVLQGWKRDEKKRQDAGERVVGNPVPETLEKELAVAPLLERFELEGFREKNGPSETARRLEQILEFATECGSVVNWEWVGKGKLPEKLRVIMPTPITPADSEQDIVQEDLFPSLTSGGEANGEKGQDEWETLEFEDVFEDPEGEE